MTKATEKYLNRALDTMSSESFWSNIMRMWFTDTAEFHALSNKEQALIKKCLTELSQRFAQEAQETYY